MTWNRADLNGTSQSKKTRTPVTPPAQALGQPELLDADGQPTMSVFEAMNVNAEGFWGQTEAQRYPAEMERELLRGFGWPSEREWHLYRRFVTRDIQAT